MTALAALPVTARRNGSPPHLLRWLLRLHRTALLVWVVLVLVLAGLLLWLGGPLTDAAAEGWKQYHACASGGCVYDPSAVGRYKDWYTYTTIAVLAVPFLVAAWAGATLTSRELEHGTAQLAWTQSVSPARWLAAKLAVPAVLVTVGSGLLVGLHHWAWSTGQGRRLDSAKNWYDIGTYAANGTATAAMALAALVIGALFGLLKRNSLASLVGSLLATAFLWSVMAIATPHLWPTVTKVSSLKNNVPQGSGIVVDQGLLTSTGAHIADPHCGAIDKGCQTLYAKLDAVGYYNDYHPQSHYWPLQLTATAIILAVTAALTVAAFALLKRRFGPAPALKAAAV